jgi:hypothetical protein
MDVRDNEAIPASALRRCDDLVAMHRLVTRGAAVGELAQWLSERTRCWVALVDGDGAVRHARSAPGAPAGALGLLGEADPVRLLAHGRRSAVVDVGELTGVFMSVSAEESILAVVGDRPLAAELPRVLADAAPLFQVAMRLEKAEGDRTRVAIADARNREAVLHLLTSGQVSTARQVAGTLLPALPDMVRVYVVECGSADRRRIAERCARATGGQAWVVTCPVYDQHLIALVPSAAETDLAEAITAAVPGCVVAVSDIVPLRDTAVGYEQAFHVLPAARTSPERRAAFGTTTDPAVLAGSLGLGWACTLLDPVLRYVPVRGQDPGLQELLATARSWLSFGGGASRHLRLHRNTLTARLRHIEDLLRLDLSRIPDQAALSFALRVHDLPRAADAAYAPAEDSLDAVLDQPALRDWAELQVAQVREARLPAGLETLRVWLEQDARLSATATALGISVPGARKRLTRLEEAIGRSLLHPPSARYDLWLALRTLDPTVTEPSETADDSDRAT